MSTLQPVLPDDRSKHPNLPVPSMKHQQQQRRTLPELAYASRGWSVVIRDDRRNRIAERLPSRVQWYLVEDQLLWERCSTGRPAARNAGEQPEDELMHAEAIFSGSRRRSRTSRAVILTSHRLAQGQLRRVHHFRQVPARPARSFDPSTPVGWSA